MEPNTVTVAKKITIGGMGINAKEVAATLAKDGDMISVAKIYGKAKAYKEQPSKLDPTKNDVKFIGDFEAINLLTGEVTNAPTCYLPGSAADATYAAMQGVAEDEFVVFGVEIAIKKWSKSPVGYVYGVAVPRRPEAADPLAEIREKMIGQAARPALTDQSSETPDKSKAKK